MGISPLPPPVPTFKTGHLNIKTLQQWPKRFKSTTLRDFKVKTWCKFLLWSFNLLIDVNFKFISDDENVERTWFLRLILITYIPLFTVQLGGTENHGISPGETVNWLLLWTFESFVRLLVNRPILNLKVWYLGGSN